jgi:hypothetical protein
LVKKNLERKQKDQRVEINWRKKLDYMKSVVLNCTDLVLFLDILLEEYDKLNFISSKKKIKISYWGD